MPKKRLSSQPWWRQKRLLRRLAWGAALAVVVVVAVPVGLLALWDSDSGRQQYWTEPAAAFTLPTVAGGQVSLADHLGRHNVLLFFNEGVGCQACYQQVVDLEKDWKRFEALDVELVSIMVDPLQQVGADVGRWGITSIVATDVDKKVSNTYDAMEASMHPGVKPGHTFVLVNKAGQIIWRWDWPGHGKPMYLEVDELYKEVIKRLESG